MYLHPLTASRGCKGYNPYEIRDLGQSPFLQKVYKHEKASLDSGEIMKDFIIKGRTVEHVVTFLFIIAIVTIINIFVLKYTGWLCDCSQEEPAKKTSDLVKKAVVIEEEEEIPILLDAPVEETIVITETPKPTKVVVTPPSEPKKTEEDTLGIPDGSFTLTIDDVSYDLKNKDLPDADFVAVKTVTVTMKNNKIDFIPFVTFYLYDDQHKENKNQYGESTYLDMLKKGIKRTEDVPLQSLSLEDIDKDKTIVVRITNAADDSLIEREEYTFTP